MSVSMYRRRRGRVRASITRLSTRVKELERKPDPASLSTADNLSRKLESLDSEFHKYHYNVIDLVDGGDDTTLAAEQDVLDKHEEIESLTTCIKQCIIACSSSHDHNLYKVTQRKVYRIEKGIQEIHKSINASPPPNDACLLSQYEEQLRDLKTELVSAFDNIVTMDLTDSDAISMSHVTIEKEIFDCGLKVKQLIAATLSSSSLSGSATHSAGAYVKLPKLEVPMFDGQVTNCHTFWEQFEISVHSHPPFSDSEKLVYLKQALIGGAERNVIEGLSGTGSHYVRAVESLHAQYNRPRLLHQTHVQMVLQAANLKEGTGKELRCLHDTVQQHLRALSAMGYYKPPG